MAAIDRLTEGFILLDTDLRVVHANIAVKSILPRLAEDLVDGADFCDWFRQAIDAKEFTGDRVGDFLCWLQRHDNASALELAVATKGGRTIRFRGDATGTRDIMVTLTCLTPTCKGSSAVSNARAQAVPTDLLRFAETMTIARTEVGEALRRVEQTNLALAREVAERRALERELRRLADTDDLTGAINRRRFFEILRTPETMPDSEDRGHALLMIDVDHFKAINDAYGHQAGDEALAALVYLCRRTLPRIYPLARLGGEEFAALLTNISADAVLEWAEQLRCNVVDHPFRCGDRHFRLTVSIGGVVFKECPDDPLLLLSRADQALYRAKRDGRNCVFIAEDRAAPQTATASLPEA